METIKFDFVEEEIILNPHYEPHKRGRNWVCKITGKNSIDFERHKVKFFENKISTSSFKAGDALEMGGDYISSSGNRTPDRGYYLVKEICEDGVLMEQYLTLAKLLKAKNTLINHELKENGQMLETSSQKQK